MGHVLSWDANVEHDLKEYHVFRCQRQPCTKADALVAIVPQQDQPGLGLPNTNTYYVVYAINDANQWSPPSETVYCPCG